MSKTFFYKKPAVLSSEVVRKALNSDSIENRYLTLLPYKNYKNMKDLIEQGLSIFDGYPVLYTIAALAVLVILSAILNFIAKHIVLRIARKALLLTPIGNLGQTGLEKIVARAVNIIPALAFTRGLVLVPELPEMVAEFLKHSAMTFIVFTQGLTVVAVLTFIEEIHNARDPFQKRPIRGYIQLGKLIIYLITAIIMISVILNKSPVILLSGLGALAAVLMLVFQDTLLSLVASVQISANGMVRVGDWIEVPSLNVDGIVIDLALHTVKVQNWDRTFTTFPTRRLIADPFKNWRGMQDSGGRRIKRTILIDQSSIHFLTQAERESLRSMGLAKDYLEQEEAEIARWNEQNTNGNKIIQRHLTNVGAFQSYVLTYLHTHPNVVHNDTILVRQMAPGETGLPIEIYCFVATTDWNLYEDLQANIFNHLYSIISLFGLSIFQQPSGHDIVYAVRTGVRDAIAGTKTATHDSSSIDKS